MLDIEQQQIQDRAKRYQSQAYEAPQGRMVGRHYVAPNILQHIAAGLRGYGSIQGVNQSQQDLKDLQTKRQTGLADALRQYGQDMNPSQLGMGATNLVQDALPDDLKTVTLPNNYGARVPDATGALEKLASNPYSSAVGMEMFKTNAAKQLEKAQAKAETQGYANIISANAGDPQAAVRAGVPSKAVEDYYNAKNIGRDEVKYEDIGGEKVPVTKYGDRPSNVQSLIKTGNPFSDLVVLGPDGKTLVQNTPVVQAKTRISKAGSANVDARTFNNQESEQSKTYGKTLGDIRGKITQAGFDAPKQLAKLDRMDALLQGVDGGAAAPTLAQISSMANTFGVKLDKNLGPKEAAIALAVQMATGMREPGTGAFTDADFNNFLKTVPDLSKSAEGRKQIMTTMRAATNRDLEVAKFSRDYAKKNNGVLDDNFFDAVADFYAKNPVVNIPMPPTNARGDSFKVVR
jgi:hypothetical protein